MKFLQICEFGPFDQDLIIWGMGFFWFVYLFACLLAF